MNKFFISIAALLFAFHVSNAQTEKGTETFGLSFAHTSNSADNTNIAAVTNALTTLNTKTSSFSVSPNFSYFIADRIDVGINLSYSHSNTTDVTEKFSTTNDNYAASQPAHSIGGSAFIRKAYMYKNIGFRTGAYLGFGSGVSATDYAPSLAMYNSSTTSSFFYTGLALDVVYYPVKNLGVSASLANLEYEHYSSDKGSLGNGSGNYFNFNFANSGLTLSVFYVLGKKTK